jgi:hypothetical protein
MIGLNFACAIVEMGPALPTVTVISNVAPTDTIPEFAGKTFINGLACPFPCKATNVIERVKIMSFKNFILIIFICVLL